MKAVGAIGSTFALWVLVYTGAPVLAAPASYTPQFQPADCMFAVQNETSQCGYVTVPQDRANPEGLKLSLAVKVYPSLAETPEPDPVILLVGGPGNPSAFYQIAKDYNKRVAPFRDSRDVVVVDQRGNGFSTPSLQCPEYVSDTVTSYSGYRNYHESLGLLVDSMKRCRAVHTKNGIKLESYNTFENAADINDVRRALGYPSMNLMGWSYGTKLSLTIINRHGEYVRSALLGSIYPPTSTFIHAIAGAEAAFSRLFTMCREDAACNSAYPDLEKVFHEAAARYDATPLKLKIVDPLPNSPLKGVTVEWLFSGGQISGLLYGEMYSADLIGKAPKAIYRIAAGDEEFIKSLVIRNVIVMPAYLNFGQLMAFQCNETMAFERQHIIDKALELYPGAGSLEYGRILTLIPRGIELCEGYVDMSQADPSILNPVISDIPVIMFNGDLDSATPVGDALDAASHLKNSQLFILPGIGHNPMLEGDCPVSMMQQFIDNPMAPVEDECLKSDFPGVVFEMPENAN